MPATETVLLLPTVFEENVPVADVVEMVTVSLEIMPTKAAEPRFRDAVVFWSYVLLLAVTPETVRVLAMMFADVVGWVSV